ncbi:TetR/AcrR family transcriptional regulator [Nocardia paucivorans]|uniref:TetR/AcrR family transcriptional regulator n=1 Tax=Nocardia paucivorans TaxID=114259 RepID=UPI00031EE540|nr:TetR/AcrR family transcriptional regulator [Nocardia paucivorans]
MTETTRTTARHSVMRQKRLQVTTDAIVQAAQRAMDEHGLDVTVDEIAALAGVGRRTVFRHFPTREDLIQAAVTADFADFFGSLPPYEGTDWENWLADLARRVHRRTAEAGRVISHLRTRRLPPRLADAYHEHLRALHRMFTTITTTLWEAADGEGTPPDRLRRTVAAHLSPLFTQAVLLDAEGTPEFAAEMASTAIIATVRGLLGSHP